MTRIYVGYDFEDEPKGKYFYELPAQYCSYCDKQVNEEWQGQTCEFCGEYHFLYTKKLGHNWRV